MLSCSNAAGEMRPCKVVEYMLADESLQEEAIRSNPSAANPKLLFLLSSSSLTTKSIPKVHLANKSVDSNSRIYF